MKNQIYVYASNYKSDLYALINKRIDNLKNDPINKDEAGSLDTTIRINELMRLLDQI